MQLCDVTLREGDQMPGRSYTVDQKVAAGRELDRLGLAYIQAGFPVTGVKDREAVRRLAESSNAEVIGLARSLSSDVDAALEAEADIIEVIAGFSNYQLEHVIDTTRAEMVDALLEAVDRARGGGVTVHVTLVDAFRTRQEDLVEVFECVPDAEIINLADTVGVRTPDEVGAFLGALSADVDLNRVGAHFHDDMGVATANALAAIDAGVRKVDASVAALGERAGNPALEEVIVGETLRDGTPAIKAADQLIPVCRAILDILDESVPPRKAILGDEVTTHESGLHTAAMMDDPAVFEPFDPARFGGERRLVFGEGSGRSSATKLLTRAGREPTEEAVNDMLNLLAERGPLSLDEAVALVGNEFQ